jgi:hypothetical protein
MREKIIEIIYKAINNAFAFENYDHPKSEYELSKSNEFFADEILKLTQPTEKPDLDEIISDLRKVTEEAFNILGYQSPRLRLKITYIIDKLKQLNK